MTTTTTTTVRTEPARRALCVRNVDGLGLSVAFKDDSCVVRIVGELDLATRDRLLLACAARHHLSVVVDLSGLTFMDCSGYCGIVAARNVLEEDGRTLMVRGGRGQPGRLLTWIGELERQPSQGAERAGTDDVTGTSRRRDDAL